MARDETRSARAELDRQEPQEDAAPTPEAPAAATDETQPAPQDAADAIEQTDGVRVVLAPDSDLEAPVAVTVPGLYSDVEPLPHPDAIRDDDDNFLPGFDEDTVTLEKTDDGYQRPADAEQPEAVVPVDDDGRLVLSDSAVEVPANVANVLVPLPYVKVETA